MKHELKILPQYFYFVALGVKRFELRKDDRNFSLGDICYLREWSPDTGYTGNYYPIQITYILRNCPEYGLKDGYCIFGW